MARRITSNWRTMKVAFARPIMAYITTFTRIIMTYCATRTWATMAC
jgi:hypothetical protein